MTFDPWVFKKEQFERGGRAERCSGGLGAKRLKEGGLTHPRRSRTQNKERREKEHENEKVLQREPESRGEEGAARGLSHPSASSGRRGCVWLVRGEREARIRSMDALNADQSLTTPLGVGISV